MSGEDKIIQVSKGVSPLQPAAGFQGHPARKRARDRNHKQAGISYNQKYYFRLLALMGKNAVFLAPPPLSFSSLTRSVKAIALGCKERPKFKAVRGLKGSGGHPQLC